ncbi:MAG: hypothetical protein V1493_05410 [Candidatus Diapherotrites archaeon]
MQFLKMAGIALILLSLLPPALSAECDSIELHPSIMIAEGKATIAVLAECNGMALSNTDVQITYPSGKTVDAKTGANGEIAIQPSEEGSFLFTISGEVSNETIVRYEKKLGISISRTADTYTICLDQSVPQIEIIDNGTLNILLTDEKNCAVYTSASGSFEVKVQRGEGEPVQAPAGKILSIKVQETIKVGQSFIAIAMDNSQPAQDAIVSFGGQQKTSNASGEAVFSAENAGEFEITAEKEGMQKAVKKISVAGEFKKISVEFPEQAEVGQVIMVRVSSNGIPVENALVELGKSMKATAEDGTAFFAFQESGLSSLKVSAEGFGEFTSAIRIKAEIKKALAISAPEKIVAGQKLEIIITAAEEPAEGAKVSIGAEEKTTDNRGFVEFQITKPGSYEAKASKEGFVEIAKTIEVTEPVGTAPENNFGIIALLLLVFGLIVIILGIVRIIRKRGQYS